MSFPLSRTDSYTWALDHTPLNLFSTDVWHFLPHSHARWFLILISTTSQHINILQFLPTWKEKDILSPNIFLWLSTFLSHFLVCFSEWQTFFKILFIFPVPSAYALSLSWILLISASALYWMGLSRGRVPVPVARYGPDDVCPTHWVIIHKISWTEPGTLYLMYKHLSNKSNE